jgi:signal transduction histidine kinase
MTADLKSSRKQIEDYSRTLEDKVADRTAKLEAQNIAIRETQEALVRTTRLASVGEVAGRAAHEVLNPLTKITTRLEKIQSQALARDNQDFALIREIAEAWSKAFEKGGVPGLMSALSESSSAEPGKTLLEEDVGNLVAVTTDALSNTKARQADVDFLLQECARISKIVNGMRQLTRVSSSRREIDVHVLLDEALSSMGDLFAKNAIQIEKNYSPGVHRVYADHDELLQVLSNLLRNSMQAIQEARRSESQGPAEAKILVSTTASKSGSKGQVFIRIGDNGSGVLPENFEQIFEPTFTTKSIEEGTGLGLAIARRFVRAHDGEIRLEKSIPNVETTFLIDFPEYVETGNVS